MPGKTTKSGLLSTNGGVGLLPVSCSIAQLLNLKMVSAKWSAVMPCADYRLTTRRVLQMKTIRLSQSEFNALPVYPSNKIPLEPAGFRWKCKWGEKWFLGEYEFYGTAGYVGVKWSIIEVEDGLSNR